jgi:CRISPR-associated protein Cmr5
MTNRTLEQQRAAAALAFVQAQKDNEKQRAKLHTVIQKAPILILQNGLGQTLAFLLADTAGEGENRKAAGLLYDQLGQWLRQQGIYPGQEDLMTQLTAANRHHYLRAQQEALALLGWMKKFAEAWLKEGG